MKKNYRKLLDYLLVSLLTILGFACDKGNEDEKMMYGTPTATYKVSIVAIDAKTNNAVEGLRVRLYLGDDGSNMVKLDSAFLDSKGEANLRASAMPRFQIKVTVTDIDGATNGSYQDYSEVISVPVSDYKAGSGWNVGTVEKKIEAKVNPK